MNLVRIDPAMLIPLAPVLILVAVLLGWSLVQIVRAPVRHLPKWAWALVVVLVVPLGAVIYLIGGRARGQELRDEDLH